MPYNQSMEFIEATAFTKHIYKYLSEDEYLGLQSFLLQYPEAGKIVPDSGGVRKVRWAIAGKGKSGGVRVIYYFKRQENESTAKSKILTRRREDAKKNKICFKKNETKWHFDGFPRSRT